MCMSLDNDIREFEWSIGEFQAGARTYDNKDDPGYGLRLAVCERSRFVWFSVKDADFLYPGVLGGLTREGDVRATKADALFQHALSLLSAKDDEFLKNVQQRYDDLVPILKKATQAQLAHAQ